tara:strand:- start:366 stop:629 length:264 start_codon:yes stop_codon:yes gene_type:complete
MDTIFLDDFLVNGLLKEKEFRLKIKETNWEKYKNKRVMIKGCSSAPVPTWAYLIITANLVKYSNQIFYGEPCSAVEIYTKKIDKNMP